MCSAGQAHPREVKCISRFLEQEESGNPLGVDFTRSSAAEALVSLGYARGGSLRHVQEQEVTEICLSSSGPSGMEDQCPDLSLESRVNVCVPSLGDSGGGVTESSGRSSRVDSHSTQLAFEAVVPVIGGFGSRTSSHSSSVVQLVSSATHRSLSSTSGISQPSGMEAIRDSLLDKGYQRSVAIRVANNVRKSSAKIYDHKWSLFVKWSKERNMDPCKASCQEVAAFLTHLFENKGLAVNTIRGYRAALGRVLKHTNQLNLSEHPVMGNLFSNFDRERPVAHTVYPKWDLNLVLAALQRPPFEPLSAVSFLNLSKKNLFLLLLASGARRNELHALDITKIVKVNKDCWTVRPGDGFKAKNFNPKTGGGSFKGFNVHKLKDDLEPEGTVIKLCPLRALKLYLHRSMSRRRGIKALFITCNPKREVKEAHLNTLSSWIKHIIADTYAIAPEDYASVLHRSTHEIRALSASLALYGNVTIESILQQCRWAHSSTFINHYLRDTSGMCQGLNQFLPLQLVGGLLQKGSSGQGSGPPQ